MSHDSTSAAHATLRLLPSVAALIDVAPLRAAVADHGQDRVTAAAREVIDQLRDEVQAGRLYDPLPSVEELATRSIARLAAREQPALRPVINATGILLHTGLGRAPLASEAIEAATAAARGYCSVELDLASGDRTQRSRAVEGLLCELTGAEAAHVVNNNAGATGLTVAALAAGRELIVSHGQLIEIGGGYRLPDVIAAYGATLRPVGTTNKTRTSDYAGAIGEPTGAMMVVHPSNYQVAGFTEQPRLEELVALARQHDVPLVHDIGSGALIDFAQFGCGCEPMARESIQAGADLVLFSGDKLLGGPQCGIVVGRRDLVDRVIAHPLSRALRVDKITLATLHATLRLYQRPEKATQAIPLLKFLNTPLGELRRRAEELAERLRAKLTDWDVTAAHDEAFVGGGSLPHQAMSSWCLAIAATGGGTVEQLAHALRIGEPAVVGRIGQDRLLLCLHGVFADQDEALGKAILAAAPIACGLDSSE